MWDDGLGLNTVWVGDVVRGVLYAMEKREGGVFNFNDENETNLKKLNALISSLFQIKAVNLGSFRSYLLQWSLDEIITVMNEKHLTHWFLICQQKGVDNSPLNIISNKYFSSIRPPFSFSFFSSNLYSSFIFVPVLCLIKKF